jgi:hypothetical protein
VVLGQTDQDDGGLVAGVGIELLVPEAESARSSLVALMIVL